MEGRAGLPFHGPSLRASLPFHYKAVVAIELNRVDANAAAAGCAGNIAVTIVDIGVDATPVSNNMVQALDVGDGGGRDVPGTRSTVVAIFDGAEIGNFESRVADVGGGDKVITVDFIVDARLTGGVVRGWHVQKQGLHRLKDHACQPPTSTRCSAN